MKQSSGKQCPCSDDNGVPCPNIMTKAEEKQDGYCQRCAEALWHWLKNDEPVVFTK